jgi:hypothetical protein
MAAKRKPVKHEPFLISVARTLGHAAGTLTNVTQELRENLSTLPEGVAKKMRAAAPIRTTAKRARVRTRRRAGSHTQHSRKTSRPATRGQKTPKTKIATSEKRKSSKDESPRSRRKRITRPAPSQ